MATMGDLRDEIAGELARDDLDTQIETAITSAIREVETEKVRFNSEVDTSLTTTAGSATIALPSGFFEMISLQLSIGGVLRTMEPATPVQIMEARYQGTQNQPCAFSVFDGLIQLDTLADDTYTATITYYRTFSLPTTGTDTHTWITNAYSLIKYAAKRNLHANTLFDWENAGGFDRMAQAEMARIKKNFNTVQRYQLASN